VQERIDALREQIPTLRYSAYFDYGSYGPAPDSVLASMFNAYEQQHRLGPSSTEADAWAEEQVESARHALANELHALPEQVAFGPSISALCNAVLWGMTWQAGDHLVLSDAEHPAINAATRNLQSRLGVDVTHWAGARLPVEELLDSLQDVLRPSTRLLVISHVLWTTGETLPISSIARLCHERTNGPPVAVLVDGAQSFGAIPFTAGELLADYFVSTMHKWCCGPEALALLFARDPGSVLPTFAGWRSLDGQLKPHSGLRKLEVGTPAYAAHVGLREALLLHEQTAPAEQRHAMLRMCRRRLRLGLERMSQIQILTPATADSGILSFQLYTKAHQQLVSKLEAAGILVRALADPSCVRVCTHYFTSCAEVDLLLEAVEHFIR
jgi:L-cysteine/cystine lyase